MKYSIKIFFFFVAPLFFSCSRTVQHLSDAKEEIISYYESGGLDKEIEEVVSKASSQFETVKVNNSAVVIFDVDDTALSYYELDKSISFGYAPELWDRWVEEKTVPAVRQVKNFYDFVIDKGFNVIFISGRKDYHYDGTIRNLLSVGYTQFDTLIVRGKVEYELDAIDYKSSKRKDLTAKGYKIVGTVGDQWSDLEGPYHGIQVKIPNYIYTVE